MVDERTEEIVRQKIQIEQQRDQLQIAKNALWEEMELAKRIQTVLLPESPSIPGYELAVLMKPGQDIGKDFFDVIEVRGEWLVGSPQRDKSPAGINGQWLDAKRENIDEEVEKDCRGGACLHPDSERAVEKDGEPCRGGSCARPKDSGQPQRADFCTNDSVENRERAHAITPNNSRTPTADPGQPQGFAPTDPSPLYPSHWLTLGHVSAEGIPAGLITMMVQTAMRTALEKFHGQPCQSILENVNTVIEKNIGNLGEEKSLSLTVMKISENGLIDYAGSKPTILLFRSREKRVEVLSRFGHEENSHLNINEQAKGVFRLNTSDTMIVFGSGLINAQNTGQPFYGDEQLKSLLMTWGSNSAEEIKNAMAGSLDLIQCPEDITIMVLKKKPLGTNAEIADKVVNPELLVEKEK
jgi:serine phosphatase RsbU (regulator of sigma subunit)